MFNEISDFIQRAPKRITFDGANIVNATHYRRQWIDSLDHGTIDERINRRSGLIIFAAPVYARWRGVRSSIARHYRHEDRKKGERWAYRHLNQATD